MQSSQLKMLQSKYMFAVTPIGLLVVSFDLLGEWPLGISSSLNEFEGDLELKSEVPVGEQFCERRGVILHLRLRWKFVS